MATKKELIEAQGFSRRRLLSAFIGGAPGGKELEPAQPLRAVIAGIALTVMLIVGGVFYGLVHPGLPNGWENNRLIIASDTGARYVSIKGKLYPVINTASARLIIPAKEFKVITTDQATLGRIEIGETLGILGAPDALATPGLLVNDGWTACERDGKTFTGISTDKLATATDDAALVRVDKVLYVVAGEHRYRVDEADHDAILRAVGLSSAVAEDVDGAWLNLFDQGDGLGPIIVPNAGELLSGTDLKIGSVVHPQGSADTERFLITENRKLAKLSPLAYKLYLLGSGNTLGEAITATQSELSQLGNAQPLADTSWPVEAFTALDASATKCSLLTHSSDQSHNVLATLRADAPIPADAASVRVERGHGALVHTGDGSATLVYVIDASGTAYPVPGATEDVLARLGYTLHDLSPISGSWLSFLPVGPALTEDAAASTPQSGSATGTK